MDESITIEEAVDSLILNINKFKKATYQVLDEKYKFTSTYINSVISLSKDLYNLELRLKEEFK